MPSAVVALGVLAVPILTGQSASSVSEQELNFWVGSWTMDSSRPQDPKTKGAWQEDACTNTVAKIYGGKVIHESFKTTGFTGGSWSSYDAKGRKWRQTWVDDSGAYLLFEGGMKGKEFVLTQTNAGSQHADALCQHRSSRF